MRVNRCRVTRHDCLSRCTRRAVKYSLGNSGRSARVEARRAHLALAVHRERAKLSGLASQRRYGRVCLVPSAASGACGQSRKSSHRPALCARSRAARRSQQPAWRSALPHTAKAADFLLGRAGDLGLPTRSSACELYVRRSLAGAAVPGHCGYSGGPWRLLYRQ